MSGGLNYYLDLGWNGSGWKPSELLAIGEAVVATRPSPLLLHEAPGRRDATEGFRADMLTEARRRWKAGYWADPFTSEPRLRNTGEGR